MSVTDDPLAPPVPCWRCEHGWVFVTVRYLDRHAPLPKPLDLAHAEQADIDVFTKQLADAEARRRAMVNTVYPCETCQPDLFFRWRGRHLESAHDRAECVECIAAGVNDRGAPRRARRKKPVEPPERKDLE